MSAYLSDWLNLLIRWAHLIAAIGWIGTSFYFIALDQALRKREQMKAGVLGTAWEVHGGGFYHVEKFTVAPPELPPDLVWFKWEAYLTWLTGFALLVAQFYLNPTVWLIDPAVMVLEPWVAIATSIASLVLGWLVYDGICRSPIGRNTVVLAIVVFALILAVSALYTNVFSARSSLVHVGAFIGTLMAVNVFGVIIPNQKKAVAALLAGETPDARYGQIGKQRSVHNTYLTLPVIVFMVGGHYPMLTAHTHTWLLVGLVIVGGACARHFLMRHEAGDGMAKIAWALPVVACVALVAMWMTAPPRVAPAQAQTVSDEEVMAITRVHCATCHGTTPTHEIFKTAPKGVVLESVDDLRRYSVLIEQQAVRTPMMPLGNASGMTQQERELLGCLVISAIGGHRNLSLAQLNACSGDEFVAALGDVAECSPWVAVAAAELRPFVDPEALIRTFVHVVNTADEARQLDLIRAHPDLAGRAARAGNLTEDSRQEQAQAGLAQLSDEQFDRFHALNNAYKLRFGFPFIFAVKGARVGQILAAFENRLSNEPSVEHAIAIENIARIMRFRLEDRLA